MNWKYLKYVLIHKWHVARFCFKYGYYWRGIKHDWSKFLPSEWRPYAHYFYGNHMKWSELAGDVKNWVPYSRTKEYWKERFDYAWLLHQKRNDHHFQYWLLRMDSRELVALPMPAAPMFEMIADWCGAGIAITGKLEVWDWYERNKDSILLHPQTRCQVEAQLHRLRLEYEQTPI